MDHPSDGAMNSFQIGHRLVGTDVPPFVIAEMSGNHNQSLSRAIELVEAAAASGADALKLQTYTADTITLKSESPDFTITDPESLWAGKNLHELYQQAHTPWDWHKPIMDRAKELGMVCFSSPFDETAVDFLNELDVPAFKIASFENNHIPLIRKAASTGKPLIISTGMASLSDLDRAVNTAHEAGCEKIILLKCTSTYPASPVNTNLRTIPHLRDLFGVQVGLSDHTAGVGVAVASVALGATVIEKHFTLSRHDGGVDSQFSLEPDELAALVVETKQAWEALGNITYGPTVAEVKSLAFRRSIYACKDIAVGDKFTAENIRIVRPGYGAPPYFFDQIIGKSAKQFYSSGTPLSLDHLF